MINVWAAQVLISASRGLLLLWHGGGNARDQSAQQRATLEPVAITMANTSAKSNRGAIRNLFEFWAGILLLRWKKYGST